MGFHSKSDSPGVDIVKRGLVWYQESIKSQRGPLRELQFNY